MNAGGGSERRAYAAVQKRDVPWRAKAANLQETGMKKEVQKEDLMII